jgi:predicted GNAT family N-acyltransferase
VSVTIRRALPGGEREAALALRHRVFCQEQGVPEHDELDGRDGDAVHLVAIDEDRGTVVGTCRLVLAGPTVQFSRLAVEPAYRRQGIATRLLAAADEEGRAAGVRRLLLHAQTYALALYAGHGYRAKGSRFVEAGIEHVAMEKPLA